MPCSFDASGPSRSTPARVVILADSGALSPRLSEEITTLLSRGYSVLAVKVVGADRPAVREYKGDTYSEIYIQAGTVAGWRMAIGIVPLYFRILRLFRSRDADVFHAGHLFLLPIALILSRWKHAKAVYDAYEFHAVTWARYVPICRSSVQAVLESLENRLASRADCVLTVDSVGRTLENRFRRHNSNVTVLFNVPRSSRAVDTARAMRVKSTFAGSEVIAYAGGISEAKGETIALEAMRLVRQECPAARLLLIGSTSASASAVNDVMAARIGWIPYEELLDYLQVAVLGLALYQRTQHFELLSRGNARKIFSYMQAGLPIVTSDVGEISLLVKEQQCGIVVDPADVRQVAKAITRLLCDPAMAAEMGQRGRAAIENKYNWEIEQEKMMRGYALAGIQGAGVCGNGE